MISGPAIPTTTSRMRGAFSIFQKLVWGQSFIDGALRTKKEVLVSICKLYEKPPKTGTLFTNSLAAYPVMAIMARRPLLSSLSCMVRLSWSLPL